MRRFDREVKEFNDIVKIMETCDVCRIALNNNGYPYILPLNFGLKAEKNSVELYFHGANEGTKYNIIKADNRASFEMDCKHRLITDTDRGYCTMEYKSVIGQGHIEMLSDEEKYDALCVLMKHYHQKTFPFNKAAMPRTTVFKLIVEEMTGKARIKKAEKP
ncbi:MAG: pyridoxamine 5'-phosphate oxidase family protein [Clostridiaceae bacterium]|nr:pyridoxamine 5'-phosphate oxidase family protein [Clostridiaceae bacterium]